MLAFRNTTRYRFGDCDDEARAAHTAETTSWKRGIAEVVFTPEDQQVLLDAIRAGATVTAAAALGLSFQAVYGRGSWDEEFRDALDTALADTCPAAHACGTPSGVKHGGHCRDCCAAHHPPRRQGRRTRR
jgi:hypothetical protein